MRVGREHDATHPRRRTREGDPRRNLRCDAPGLRPLGGAAPGLRWSDPEEDPRPDREAGLGRARPRREGRRARPPGRRHGGHLHRPAANARRHRRGPDSAGRRCDRPAVPQRDKRAAGNVISLIEDDEPEAVDALRRIYPHTGRAHVVGFTGPPGVGKSSLINRLVRTFRSRGKTVGVVAVDPTSPYTGGAVLGDRIRMADTGVDAGVFIRSMATRGHAGGLALATFDAVPVLDAIGSSLVFVETVGAGQSEGEIASRAHTTGVVERAPAGDG